MDYDKDILNRLLDIYERRAAFDKNADGLRAIQVDIKKLYPDYADRYNHESYREINAAIEKICGLGFVNAEKDRTGQYARIKLNVGSISDCYTLLGRVSVPEQCEKAKKKLLQHRQFEHPLFQTVLNDWLELLDAHKKLPYDLKLDENRINDVTCVLKAILKLNKETYIRNFSTALFKDSKKFQREYRNITESILFDYTDEVVEKEDILGFYNLYENPTYVLIKGDVEIRFAHSVINVGEMPGGIALPGAAVETIQAITIKKENVITVENLTTYHDSDEENSVHLYLGGYHNQSKQNFLGKIYNENGDKNYFHKGDIDVYGFLILENLKEKTSIPFEPLMMDIATIKRFYNAGLYKELTASDVKVIREKISVILKPYADVLQFMLDHNCKVEQESIRAVDLIENKEYEATL